MIAVPLTRDEANAYVKEHHRHHGRVTGHRFIVGAVKDGELVGIAIAGRPNAHRVPQYEVAEVTRLCTDGTPNVCSFLYSRCSRIAREWGFKRIFTYILEAETGASLRAAGWVFERMTRGGTHDRPSRRRTDKSPTCPKQCWAPSWCAVRSEAA